MSQCGCKLLNFNKNVLKKDKIVNVLKQIKVNLNYN